MLHRRWAAHPPRADAPHSEDGTIGGNPRFKAALVFFVSQSSFLVADLDKPNPEHAIDFSPNYYKWPIRVSFPTFAGS